MIENLSYDQSFWLKEELRLINNKPIISSSRLRVESSQRDFYRINFYDETNVILMVVPEGIEESVSSFTKKAEIFKRNDVNVPLIFSENEKLGLIIVEDFGDELYQFNLSKKNVDLFYGLALQELIKIQSIELDKNIFKYLDKKLLSQNWSLFEEIFLNNFFEDKIKTSSINNLKDCYEMICRNLLKQPQVICHYDFECRNLIFTKNKAGILDFQDAIIGPIGLDPASLFKDLYYFWPEIKILGWYEDYQKSITNNLKINIKISKLQEYIDYCSLQRQFRILGKLSKVYLDLDRTDRLKDFPTLINYLVETSSKYEELKPISEILRPLKEILNNKIAKII